MSMILNLYSLSDAHVHAVLADPPLVWEVLGTRHPALRALGALEQSSGLDLAQDEVEEASLDKAWHGIHYLLTGSAWEGELPLGFICQGGSAVGDIDLGCRMRRPDPRQGRDRDQQRDQRAADREARVAERAAPAGLREARWQSRRDLSHGSPSGADRSRRRAHRR